MDEEPNYDSYNLRQIRDVFAHIDRDAYPDRFAKILKRKQELESKIHQERVLRAGLPEVEKSQVHRKLFYGYSYKYKSLVCFVVFLMCLGMFFSPEKYPSEDLNDYMFKKVTVMSTSIKEYTGKGGYFEFEIYDSESNRYFLRDSNSLRFRVLELNLHEGVLIGLHFIGDGYQKGRIANIKVGDKDLIAISLKPDNGKTFILLSALLAAVLSVFFFKQRSKDRNDEKIFYL